MSFSFVSMMSVNSFCTWSFDFKTNLLNNNKTIQNYKYLLRVLSNLVQFDFSIYSVKIMNIYIIRELK